LRAIKENFTVTKAYSPSPEDIDVYPEEINDP
jgi:hypothetical protein